ncbi:MAG: hypothetical protein AB7T06_20490 [Kofleriaceae bacterium]
MRVAVAIVVIVGVGACYAPSFPTGAPCDELHPCPSALVCTKAGTCETSESVEPDPDANIVDMPDAPIDACVSMGAEVCDDGIDQDCDGLDSTCAANDVATNPVDVTNGGTFNGDLANATDTFAQRGCGDVGGRELFYKITLTAAEVYYIDTFGSDFDTSVRVYAGTPCNQLDATVTPTTCDDDACGTEQSQFAFPLPSGTSCIVVDQNAGSTDDDLTLHVTRSRRTGTPLGDGMQTLTGDTCTSTNSGNPNIPCNDADNDAKDVSWYFTSCPGVNRRLDASTCVDVTMVHFDTVLYVHKSGVQADLVCRDDSEPPCTPRPDRPDHVDGTVLTNVNTTGPGLFWLVLDGFGMDACGGYRLDTNLD